MTDDEKNRKIPVKNNEAEAAEETPEVEAPETEEQPVDEAASARAEAKEYQDKYLRLYADTENYKKRMQREAVESRKFNNEAIIKELLPVLDNLERALSHAGDSGEGIVDGVKMVRKQLADCLTRFGVTEVNNPGGKFDPNVEQAIAQVESEDHESGTVVDVVQKGYLLNERLLRPAMVTVAK